MRKKFFSVVIVFVLVFLINCNVFASMSNDSKCETTDLEGFEGNFFPQLQKALIENPKLSSFYNHSIEILNRELILDGKTTGYNIDYPNPGQWVQLVPDKDCSWTCSKYSNRIFYIRKEYEGLECHEHKEVYIDENGNHSLVSYQVPYMNYDAVDDNQNYAKVGEVIENGKKISKYAPYFVKEVYFVEKYTFGKSEKYVLKLPYSGNYSSELSIVGFKNNKLLIKDNYCLLGVFDINKKIFSVITNEAYDFKILGDELYFTDWKHDEYVCNWSKNVKSTLTGAENVYYNFEDFELKKKEEFQKEFLKVQNELKKGADFEEYDIDFFDIVAFNDEECGSIHLPFASEYNQNIMVPEFGSWWYIDNYILKLSRFGESIIEIKLPQSIWQIVKTDVELPRDDSILDSDNNGIVTSSEIRKAVKNISVLLYNFSARELYQVKNDKSLRKITGDVQEFYESNGIVYWRDSQNRAYCSDWSKDEEARFLAKDIIGFLKNEENSLIISPEDSREHRIVGKYHVIDID